MHLPVTFGLRFPFGYGRCSLRLVICPHDTDTFTFEHSLFGYLPTHNCDVPVRLFGQRCCPPVVGSGYTVCDVYRLGCITATNLTPFQLRCHGYIYGCFVTLVTTLHGCTRIYTCRLWFGLGLQHNVTVVITCRGVVCVYVTFYRLTVHSTRFPIYVSYGCLLPILPVTFTHVPVPIAGPDCIYSCYAFCDYGCLHVVAHLLPVYTLRLWLHFRLFPLLTHRLLRTHFVPFCS